MELLGTVGRVIRNATPVPMSRRSSGYDAGFLGLDRGSRLAQLDSMGTVSTLFAVVSAIAEGTAKQAWYMERIRRDNRVYGPTRETRVPLLQHPALDLWEKPNPFYSRHDLVETCTQHLKLCGEAYWVLVRIKAFGGLPLEMWPVRPDRMQPVPHPTEFLTGWTYTSPDGERVPLDVADVIQIKTPNPVDPYRGMGPVQALLADLDSVRYSAEWNRKFFMNDASPGGIIESDDRLNDADWRKFRDRWSEQHRGVNNAHRVALLERMHWKDRGYSMRDMQFTQLRDVGRDVILEAFRVHKSIVGRSDDVNRANAVAARDQMAEGNIDPTLSRYQGALNTRLLPLYGDVTTAFCFESAVQGDAQADATELATRAGVFSTLKGAGVDPVDAALVAGLPAMAMAAVPDMPAEPVPTPSEAA